MTQLFRSFRPVRHQPGVQPLHPVEAIVGRPVQRQDLHPRLDQGDEGQEQLPVETMFVEIGRRPVRCGDNPYPSVDERGEQPAHDHCVGRIGDHHLVEGKEAKLLSDVRRHAQDRVAFLSLARLAQPLVHFQHEVMEVGASLRLDVDALKGEDH